MRCRREEEGWNGRVGRTLISWLASSLAGMRQSWSMEMTPFTTFSISCQHIAPHHMGQGLGETIHLKT